MFYKLSQLRSISFDKHVYTFEIEKYLDSNRIVYYFSGLPDPTPATIAKVLGNDKTYVTLIYAL